MTPEELKWLRELCERATPGPWKGDEFEMLAPKAPTLIPGNVKIVWAEDHHRNEWEVSVKWYDDEQGYGPFYLTADTAPEAICLAALKALGINV